MQTATFAFLLVSSLISCSRAESQPAASLAADAAPASIASATPSAPVVVLPAPGPAQPVRDPAPQPIPQPANARDDFDLSVSQHPCFGPCPVYALRVDAKGHVSAGPNTRAMRAVGTLSPADFDQLVKVFYDAGFFDLRDVYPMGHTDASSSVLELHSGGRSKTVRHDHSSREAPEELSRLETRIEELTGVLKYAARGPGSAVPKPIVW